MHIWLHLVTRRHAISGVEGEKHASHDPQAGILNPDLKTRERALQAARHRLVWVGASLGPVSGCARTRSCRVVRGRCVVGTWTPGVCCLDRPPAGVFVVPNADLRHGFLVPTVKPGRLVAKYRRPPNDMVLTCPGRGGSLRWRDGALPAAVLPPGRLSHSEPQTRNFLFYFYCEVCTGGRR